LARAFGFGLVIGGFFFGVVTASRVAEKSSSDTSDTSDTGGFGFASMSGLIDDTFGLSSLSDNDSTSFSPVKLERAVVAAKRERRLWLLGGQRRRLGGAKRQRRLLCRRGGRLGGSGGGERLLDDRRGALGGCRGRLGGRLALALKVVRQFVEVVEVVVVVGRLHLGGAVLLGDLLAQQLVGLVALVLLARKLVEVPRRAR
jgi:hypothetical protein